VDPHFPLLEDVWMEPGAILDRVWVHLNTVTVNPDTVLYFYCALELRFFIEALFFELLMRARRGQPTRQDRSLYRPRDFDRALSALHPDYVSEATRAMGWDITPSTIEHVRHLYGRLGALLHLPKEPRLVDDQHEWKGAVERTVLQAFHDLRVIVGYGYPGERMTAS
jgi:hypothetical protein